MARKLAPMHPGEVLREEFLVPLGLSAGALAKACGVPRTRIERMRNCASEVRAIRAPRNDDGVTHAEFALWSAVSQRPKSRARRTSHG